MASKLDNSTKMKLWVIFGVFLALIVGLLGMEIDDYFEIQEARKNFEQIRRFEMKELEKDYQEIDTVIPSKETQTETEDSTQVDSL